MPDRAVTLEPSLEQEIEAKAVVGVKALDPALAERPDVSGLCGPERKVNTMARNFEKEITDVLNERNRIDKRIAEARLELEDAELEKRQYEASVANLVMAAGPARKVDPDIAQRALDPADESVSFEDAFNPPPQPDNTPKDQLVKVIPVPEPLEVSLPEEREIPKPIVILPDPAVDVPPSQAGVFTTPVPLEPRNVDNPTDTPTTPAIVHPDPGQTGVVSEAGQVNPPPANIAPGEPAPVFTQVEPAKPVVTDPKPTAEVPNPPKELASPDTSNGPKVGQGGPSLGSPALGSDPDVSQREGEKAQPVGPAAPDTVQLNAPNIPANFDIPPGEKPVEAGFTSAGTPAVNPDGDAGKGASPGGLGGQADPNNKT